MPTAKTLGLTALGILVGAFVLSHFASDQPDYFGAYVLVGLTGTILGFQIAKVISGEIPWYYPHAIVLASYFMMYVAAPAVTMWIGPYSEFYGRDLTGYELSMALGVGAVGAFFYLVGYKFGPKRPRLPRRFEWYFTDSPAVQNLFPTMVLLILGLGLASWAYGYVATGGVQAHLQDMGGGRRELNAASGGVVSHIGKFIWLAAALWMSRYGPRLTTFLVIGLVSLPLLLYGSRSYIAILLLGSFIVWRFRWTNKVPMIVWAGMAASLILLMSFYVLLRATGGNLGEAKRAYSQQVATTEGRVATVTHSFSFIVPMAETVAETGDKIPYQYGKTLLTVFYVIPNMIWPNKQEYFERADRLYTAGLFPHRADKITITPSIMAEFYMNFGWLGVVFCPIGIGYVIRWFEGVTLEHPHRKHQVAWIAFAAIVSVNLLRVMKNGFGTIVFTIYFAVPVFIVYWPNMSLLFSPPPEGAEDEGIESDEYGYFGWEEGEYDEESYATP